MDDTRGAAKRVGTDALKININTGGEGGGLIVLGKGKILNAIVRQNTVSRHGS